MDGEQVSAFAVYAEKKKLMKKKANDKLGLGNKSRVKLKKKKKGPINVSNSLLGALHEKKGTEKLKDKEKSTPVKKKTMVKSLLKAQIESIFEAGNNNKTLKKETNTHEYVNGTGKKKCDNNFKKKEKKKKFLNGDITQKSMNSLSGHEHKPGEEKKKVEESHGKKNHHTPSLIYGDSVKMGENVLSWLLSPIDLKDFFNDSWEKKPLHIQRNNEKYYQEICTINTFKTALKEKDMYFTKNIDVTSYINGERFTENPEGKATVPVVWDLLNGGKSIRLLNPQSFIPNIRLLNTTLQEFFHCFVGANIYLTPAGTQGFAPHYDDIEAFVLQLEGEKLWTLYNPRCPEEVLPRESSTNFSQEEIGEPILEVTLKAGDLLYFPRGVIHQAKALPNAHSLHVTVSCYQKSTWADLFEKVVPVALEQVISSDVEFRKGLPIGYLNHMGMLFSDKKSRLRDEMIRKFEELGRKLIRECPLDAGVDQMGVDFMQEALPPCLSEEEKVYGADRNVSYQDRDFLEGLRKHSDKKLGVKLIRATCVRLVSENEVVRLYYTTDNSVVYRETEVSAVEIPVRWIPAVEHLIRSYPNFVGMESLQVMKKGNKPGKWKEIAEFVYFLWQRGLVLFDKPHGAICG